jgi:Iron only hydrogenase large subunit, C-terminal domain
LTSNLPQLYPSVAIDSTTTQVYRPDGTTVIMESNDNQKNDNSPLMPVISGSCPALVCLVEKTLTDLVPHLSQTVSPMSMVGSVLKKKKQNQGQSPPQQEEPSLWDHWAVMPCHDKKLEASRKDFYLKDSQQQCVDLVISTKECVELVEEWVTASARTSETKMDMATYLQSLAPSEVANNVLQPTDLPKVVALQQAAVSSNTPVLIVPPLAKDIPNDSSPNSPSKKQMAFASGGHADYIFCYAAKHLFDCDLNDGVIWKPASLVTKAVKSARLKQQQRKLHYYEAKLFRQADGSYSCQESDEPPVLHFGIAHGMQTMQRALKVVENSNTTLHYLEAMACPHGCVNGGGSAQLASKGPKKAFASFGETPSETQSRVQATLRHLVVPEPSSSSWEYHLARTRYHVVPPMQHTMGATAGVEVDKILW